MPPPIVTGGEYARRTTRSVSRQDGGPLQPETDERAATGRHDDAELPRISLLPLIGVRSPRRADRDAPEDFARAVMQANPRPMTQRARTGQELDVQIGAAGDRERVAACERHTPRQVLETDAAEVERDAAGCVCRSGWTSVDLYTPHAHRPAFGQQRSARRLP